MTKFPIPTIPFQETIANCEVAEANAAPVKPEWMPEAIAEIRATQARIKAEAKIAKRKAGGK